MDTVTLARFDATDGSGEYRIVIVTHDDDGWYAIVDYGYGSELYGDGYATAEGALAGASDYLTAGGAWQHTATETA